MRGSVSVLFFCLLGGGFLLAQGGTLSSLVAPYTRSGMEVSILLRRNATTIAALNPSKQLIPASLAKLAVAYVALNRLGHNFRLRTSLYVCGKVERGTLMGHLLVVAYGDPTISYRFDSPDKVFGEWARAIKKMGIKSVTDGLLLDCSYLGRVETAPDYPPSQRIYSYCAPSAAATVDDSTFILILKPTYPGKPARIFLDPPGLLPVDNRTKTTSSKKAHAVHVSLKNGRLLVTGRVWRGVKRCSYRFAAPDPERLFALKFLNKLRSNGIKIRGYRVTHKKVSTKNATLVASHSHPLISVVGKMLKDSVNVYAEILLRVLGAHIRGDGSIKSGLSVLHRSLRKAGIKGVSLRNGSGLSRRSRMSAAACVAILQKLSRIAPLAKILPAPGEGTLRRRFLSSPLKKRLFAKTGHIRSVNSLAGVVISKQNIFFAIIFNKTTASGVRLHILQRRILERLCR